MKVCKKCKTHVANKAKICKNCGADVSKAKIISNSKTKANNVKKNIKSVKNANANTAKSAKEISKKNNEKLVVDVVNETKLAFEKDVVLSNDTEATIIEKEEKVVSTPESTDIIKNDEILKSKFGAFESVKNKFDSLKLKEYLFIVKSAFGKVFGKIFYCIDRILDYTSLFLANIIVCICFVLKKLFDYLSFVLLKSGKLLFFVLNELFFNLYLVLYKIGFVLKRMCKAFVKSVKSFIVTRSEKRIDKLLEKQTKIEPINVVKQEIINNNIEAVEPKISKPWKKVRVLKPIAISFIVVGLLSVAGYFGLDMYKDFKGVDAATDVVVTSEKATTDKIFGMGDYIDYNGVDYRINRVETSMGNSYKSPKSGNHFLIVYLTIRNNTDSAIPYSYENWTMSNSKGEEKKRIFTSINMETALYSGELVIGGVKNGSIVFEQPIKAKKLRINYYELKHDKEGNEVIDTKKKVFSVSIKVPTTKNKKETDKGSDVKVLKTTDTVKN